MDSYIECLCCSGNKWDAFKRSLKIFLNYSCVVFIIGIVIGSPIVFTISIIKVTSNGEGLYYFIGFLSGFIVLVEFLLLFTCIFCTLRECVLYKIRENKKQTQPQSNSSNEELPVDPPAEPIAIVVSDPT